MATALSPNNLPTPKDERWKYTNLPRAVPDGLTQQDAREETIHIKHGEICENPVEILWTGEEGTIHHPKLSITLEEGAQLTVIERFAGVGNYWQNMQTDISVGKNARLNHIRLVEDSSAAINTNMVSISADQDSVYNGFSLNLGGKMQRHDIHAILNGSNGEVSFNGLNLLEGDQHGDTTILIEHAAPHCRSNQFYRTILDGKARGVFQGKVHVHQIAQKTDGYQLSNAILLSDKAEMDTKPELEIYADDVKCSHGATTGQLDEEPLFYLRSRGLSEGQARMLLLEAFIAEVIAKIDNEPLEQDVLEKAKTWLSNALS